MSILSEEAVPSKWRTCQDLIKPSTVEETGETIENKLKVLKLTHESTETIVRSKWIKSIQRQRKLLESKVEECHELKTEVQEMKLERGDDEKDIKVWRVEIENRSTEYEKVVGGLEDLERCLREQETRETQEKEEQSKWEIKKEFEAKANGKEGDAGKPKAKLPNS